MAGHCCRVGARGPAILTAPLRLVACAATATAVLLGALDAWSAPVLRRAEVRIAFSSPTACEVAMDLDVTGVSPVPHRLELLEGASAELLEVSGGAVSTPPRDIGRTRAVDIAPGAAGDAVYTLRYRVAQSAARPYRCPLWLPAAPTTGRDRTVRIAVTVPEGMTSRGGMPALAWQGTQGQALLTHLPAFVSVPFGAPSEGRAWDVSRVMDVAAMGTLAAASIVWAIRRKGRA